MYFMYNMFIDCFTKYNAFYEIIFSSFNRLRTMFFLSEKKTGSNTTF